jgi:signal peptidase I
MQQSVKKIIRDNRSFIVFMLLMFVFRSVVADWNNVPTGSMKPTILEGDHILVNKMAYDLRVPFTHIPLLQFTDPARGDIIVFDSKASDKRLVKRVIGVPGDTISMSNNRLSINGKPLPYHIKHSNPEIIDIVENLNGLNHDIRVHLHANPEYSRFRPISVPENYYLVLGDNRDKSADSRVIGLVPRAEIVGRSSEVIMSLNYDNYYLPRTERFFKEL